MRIHQRESSKIHIFLKKMHLFCSLLEGDSATRANVSTSSALGANVRINRIVFAFRDSAHRALIDTRTASDTIGRNFVSHDILINN